MQVYEGPGDQNCRETMDAKDHEVSERRGGH
jgi:hypothetical protein